MSVTRLVVATLAEIIWKVKVYSSNVMSTNQLNA